MRRVVITGTGVVSPIGNDTQTFWKNLLDGVCGIEEISSIDTSEQKVKIGGEVKNFDPLLYMPKNKIRKTDLYTQYALAAASMAMKECNLHPEDREEEYDSSKTDIDPDRFGVYIGSGIGGMHTFVREAKKILEEGPKKVSPFFVPMMISNIAAGTVAIEYNAQGPCLPVVTACATGAHSIGEAFHAIKHDRADVILAGGCEASITPLALAGFTNCMALSKRPDPKDASIPFDKRRDGFVIGEGAGVLVLEELGHARKRNAKILGEIIGYGNTCDAYHITAPHPDARGAALSIKYAIDESFGGNEEYRKLIEKDKKIYINAHGTSTPLNDKSETLAIKKALGDDLAYKAAVSSTKSMTGHMLGAAGAVEVIASLKAASEGIIPPTIGYKEKDEECDLDYVPNEARKQGVDMALSTSLGFGGHNACIAIKPPHLI